MKLEDIRLQSDSIPVPSWSRGAHTYIRNTVIDGNQNQMVFRRKTSQTFRSAMNSLLTYSMLRKYDYDRHTLFLNNWDMEQFLTVNTDYDVWNEESTYSNLYLQTLAFLGILPVNIANEEEYEAERMNYIEYIHAKRNKNG